MVAGFLVVLVFVDTFLTGWLIRNTMQLQTDYNKTNELVDGLRDVVAELDHVIEGMHG